MIGPVFLNTDLLQFPNLSLLYLHQEHHERRPRDLPVVLNCENPLILNWARSVQMSKGMKMLKVLILKDFDISFDILHGAKLLPGASGGGLATFPALTLCNLHPLQGTRWDVGHFMRQNLLNTDREWRLFTCEEYVHTITNCSKNHIINLSSPSVLIPTSRQHGNATTSPSSAKWP